MLRYSKKPGFSLECVSWQRAESGSKLPWGSFVAWEGPEEDLKDAKVYVARADHEGGKFPGKWLIHREFFFHIGVRFQV